MASDIDWTEELVARLRALWLEGHSTAEIGRRMGITKNAVIGKVHRLHLPSRASPIRQDGSSAPRRQTVPRVRGPSLPPLRSVKEREPVPATQPPPMASRARPRADPSPSPPAPARPAVADPVRPARPVSQQPCCWPIGEPGTRGFRFCDAGAVPGKPYCAEHAAAAYVAPRTARCRPDGRSLDRYLRRELTRMP